jgi:Ca2+-binding EF-hand superfamily protein
MEIYLKKKKYKKVAAKLFDVLDNNKEGEINIREFLLVIEAIESNEFF